MENNPTIPQQLIADEEWALGPPVFSGRSGAILGCHLRMLDSSGIEMRLDWPLKNISEKTIFTIDKIVHYSYIIPMRKHPDLRSIRQARKLSLAELADRLGVTLSYVSHLETGFRKINDDLVRRLAEGLNVAQKAIRQAAEQIEYDNTLSKSWLVNIEINGSPLLEAFKYHLLASKAELDFTDSAKVRDQIVRFVADNLPFSVMAELSRNDRLLGQIAEVCRD